MKLVIDSILILICLLFFNSCFSEQDSGGDLSDQTLSGGSSDLTGETDGTSGTESSDSEGECESAEPLLATPQGDLTKTKIAYTSWDRGALYIMDTDGSNKQIISSTHISVSFPNMWSTDGTRIVYCSASGMFMDILYLVDINTLEEQEVVDDAFCGDFSKASWSPDGTKIVYERYAGNKLNLYIASTDSAALKKLLVTRARQPDWSPKGDKIVFVEHRPCDDEPMLFCGNLFIITPDGLGKKQLTQDSNCVNLYPRWSPDGNYIVWRRGCINPGSPVLGEIFVMEPDRLNEVNISNTDDLSETLPRWFPDGSKIVYKSADLDTHEIDIAIADRNGCNKINLRPRKDIGYIEWSPDGTKIAFDAPSMEGGSRRIIIMNQDGTDVKELTRGFDTRPQWQPFPKYRRPFQTGFIFNINSSSF